MSNDLHWTCIGCLKKNRTGRSGYWQHLRQSKNPLCQAVLEDLERLPSSSESESDPDSDDTDDSSNSERDPVVPIPFAGDIFGRAEDYIDDNFGQDATKYEAQEPAAGLDVGDPDESEQRILDCELEQTWEPLRARVPSDAEREMDHVQDASQCNGENTLQQSELWDDFFDSMAEEYRRAGQRADSNPHIIKYSSLHPQSKPGAVIRHDRPTDISYQNHLPSGDNTWAPFASEVDWRIAKWAKLRGAGSTAFSELLAIDGVRIQVPIKVLMVLILCFV